MGKDKDKHNIGNGFEQKSSLNAPALTEEERRHRGEKVVEALRKAREEAQKNGLTPKIAQDILDEYYAEKYGKKEDKDA